MAKMKFIYSKFFIYPLFFLALLVLYIITIGIIIPKSTELRFLEEDGLEEICKENENIYNYYYKGESYEVAGEDFGKMNDASQVILDFITSDFDSKYIFQYIWHTGKYVAFFIILILIIIATIYYSCASCIRCCTEKCCNFFSCEFCGNKCYKKIICILIPFIYLIVLIFAFIDIAFAANSIVRFSGAVCVGLQLVDSFIEGEKKDVKPKWAGAFIVADILDDLGNISATNYLKVIKDIHYNKKQYDIYLEQWKEYLEGCQTNHSEKKFEVTVPKMPSLTEEKNINIMPYHANNWTSIISNISSNDQENVETIDQVISIYENYLYPFFGCEVNDDGSIQCEDNGISKYLKKGGEEIKKLKEPLSELKSKLTEPIQNIYDQVKSSIIAIFSVIMSFIIGYSIMIEFLLSIFCCTKKCKCVAGCIKWILCFIYYTSIIIIILGFVLGIVVGVIGQLVKNATQVLEYITSHDNLNSSEPIFFNKNETSEYLKYFDVCLNGDGNLADELNLTRSFDIIDNITGISDETEELKNETMSTSPTIDYYINYLNELKTSYLESTFYFEEEQKELIFNIKDKIQEINNYVSGNYTSEESCSSINEIWSTKTTEEGYTYDNTYPDPTKETRYLIYLYEDDYSKVNFETRYDSACPTSGHPYEKVSDASKSFSKFFGQIKNNIRSSKFSEDFLYDLGKLNEIYGKKSDYLYKSLNSASNPITNIGKTFKNYILDTENIFSLLNCKFIGENKLILMDTLYVSLGESLDLFGTFLVLLSLLLFIGVVFILIVVKNNKTKKGEDSSSFDFEHLNNIYKGNDIDEKDKDDQSKPLMNY